MQCHTPIICSNTTSIPEIAGNAGPLGANPFEVNDISNAMIELFKNENPVQQLIQNGIKRKNNFSSNKIS